MPTFQPFVAFDVPRLPADYDGPAKWIMRHYSPLPRGRNVYLLTDGTVTETQPWDQATIAKTYFGGHIETITAAEAAVLTAAGYGSQITG